MFLLSLRFSFVCRYTQKICTGCRAQICSGVIFAGSNRVQHLPAGAGPGAGSQNLQVLPPLLTKLCWQSGGDIFATGRLETRRNGRVALVSLAGLAKAARVRHLGMQRGGGRRDPKLSG